MSFGKTDNEKDSLKTIVLVVIPVKKTKLVGSVKFKLKFKFSLKPGPRVEVATPFILPIKEELVVVVIFDVIDEVLEVLSLKFNTGL